MLYALLAYEHFAGGMATAALFTAMMDHTAPQTAATDYTVQASLVLAAGGLFGLPSGWVAGALGYPLHFALSATAGAGAALVAWTSSRPRPLAT